MSRKPNTTSEVSPLKVQAEQVSAFFSGRIEPESLEGFLAQCGKVAISENNVSLYMKTGKTEAEGSWIDMAWNTFPTDARVLNVKVGSFRLAKPGGGSPSQFYFKGQGELYYAGIEAGCGLGIGLDGGPKGRELVTIVTNGEISYEHYDKGDSREPTMSVRV